MSFTKKQKAAVKALVSCHETGKPIANYSALVVLSDGAGITYGAHQATHGSGTLYKIVKMYCDLSDSATSKGLEKYLSGLKNPAVRFEYAKNTALKNLLKEAGNDPQMRYAQNKVFDANYYEPAVRAAEGSNWVYPLSLAVIYDSLIQGGWTTVRDRVKGTKTEKEWIKAYVAARRKWLSSSSKSVVRNSVYRMATFEKLISTGNWSLEVPFVVHGVTVRSADLTFWISADSATGTVSSEAADSADSIKVDEPAPDYFAGNTEGVAEGTPEDASQSPETDAPQTGGKDTEEKEVIPESGIFDAGVPSETKDDGAPGDPPKAGEPAPDQPAKEGEAVVGGRPEDPPIIIDKPVDDKPSGWRTWPTTVTATLGSLGLSVGSVLTWVSGVSLTPQLQTLLGWLVIIGIVTASIYGLFYLITRAIATATEKKRNHEITMKELELRSLPDRYNVKLDRRGDTTNLTESGLPKQFVEKRTGA